MSYLEIQLPTTHKAVVKNPHDDILIPLEDGMTTAVYRGLQAWRRELMRGINASNVQEIFTRLYDPKLRQTLRDSIVNWLDKAAEAGVMQAREDVERDVFGVKAIEGIGINWEFANDAAAAWAITYGDNLVGEIAKTTTPRIQRLISDWITNGESLQTLIDRVQSGYLYSENRARTIAVTEVTRAFAQGNIEAWKASGVMELKRWNTAVDELVCPICAPLHRTTVPMNGTWPGGIESPPAHPRCRCWVTATTDFEAAERRAEQELFEQIGGDDAFVNIRPPEGRAPRGQGAEYADRRAIVSRISTQIKYRSQLQATVDNYRGQVNQRRRITIAINRIQELDKAIDASLAIADGPGDWNFKRELVNGIIEYVQAITKAR